MSTAKNTAKSLPVKPRVSEKSYLLSNSLNTYVFEVPGDSNKHQVAEAISQQFEVNVESVNIMVAKGKTKRSYRKRMRPTVGRRSNTKKAYVRLKEGDSIPVFAAMDNSETPKKEKK